MRVLLTWQLGLNLGHRTRLLPVAQKLKEEGQVLLTAVSDIQAAATVLGPHGIAFIQSPHLPKEIPLGYRATGYADTLLSQGWSDPAALWGVTQGWLGLFGLFRPDKLILDYALTFSVAARIAKIPIILICNGFELSPLADPLPPLPEFSRDSPEQARESQAHAVQKTNITLKSFRLGAIAALRDLTITEIRLLATFPELDRYGERADLEYVGPLLGQHKAPRLNWPDGEGPKIFACLRPDTSRATEMLAALSAMTSRVVCVAN